MPEGLGFEELPSDHLFSLDFDMLYSLGDVCLTFFFCLGCSLLTMQKPLTCFNKAFQPIDRSNVTKGVKVGPFVSAFESDGNQLVNALLGYGSDGQHRRSR